MRITFFLFNFINFLFLKKTENCKDNKNYIERYADLKNDKKYCLRDADCKDNYINKYCCDYIFFKYCCNQGSTNRFYEKPRIPIRIRQ